MRSPTRPRRQTRRNGEVKALVQRLMGGSETPVSAYDITRMSATAGEPLHPPQVYRALSELVAEGKVHRIETLNAFCLSKPHKSGIRICTDCGAAGQLDLHSLDAALRDAFQQQGFTVSRLILEGIGRCHRCNADTAGADVTLPATF